MIALVVLISVLFKAGVISGTTFGWCLGLAILRMLGEAAACYARSK